MECRRVCHVNGAAGHCRLVEGIPLLQLGEDVKLFNRRTACVTTRGLYRWLFWRMVVPYSIRATLAGNALYGKNHEKLYDVISVGFFSKL